MCCETDKKSERCLCSKICGMIKLIAVGTIIGCVAGMVAMYFFDRSRKLKQNTKNFIKGAENLTHDIQQKMSDIVPK